MRPAPDAPERTCWSGEMPGVASSVPQARRFAREALDATGLDEDTTDDIILLLNEVVTNAVLHPGTTLSVSVDVDTDRVRVEVADGSDTVPSLRHYQAGASTGRGVMLVEQTSSRWGVQRSHAGKSVWFEVDTTRPGGSTPELDVDLDALMARYSLEEDDTKASDSGTSTEEAIVVTYKNLHVRLAQAALEYGDALVRELTLVRLGRDERATQGETLDLGHLLGVIHDAHVRGDVTVDVTVPYTQAALRQASEFLDMVETANQRARKEDLLTPMALHEVAECWRWLLGEVINQDAGAAPTPWTLPDAHDQEYKTTSYLAATEVAHLEKMTDGVVVADDENIIIYVNGVGAEMLGWDRTDLTGGRLTRIIPEEYRSDHVAGFTRHRLTGQTVVMGNTMDLPVLKKDGTTTVMELEFSEFHGEDGRRHYQATIRPAGASAT